MDGTPTLAAPTAPGAPPAAEPAPGRHPMELWISTVLRAGVLLAGAIIALGLTLLIVRGPGASDPRSLDALRAQGNQPLSVHPLTILRQALHGQPAAIIQAGVLALILTPVLRVAMTLGLFAAQRDRVFEAITAVVLIVLVLGLIGVGS